MFRALSRVGPLCSPPFHRNYTFFVVPWNWMQAILGMQSQVLEDYYRQLPRLQYQLLRQKRLLDSFSFLWKVENVGSESYNDSCNTKVLYPLIPSAITSSLCSMAIPRHLSIRSHYVIHSIPQLIDYHLATPQALACVMALWCPTHLSSARYHTQAPHSNLATFAKFSVWQGSKF